MEQLAKLLGGTDRVKVMRLFLHHPDVAFTPKEVTDKTKSKAVAVRKEITLLASVGFLEKRKNKVYSFIGKGKKAKSVIKEIPCYKLDESFAHNQALRDLLFDFETVDRKDLASKFKAIGRIKLFIVSGIFVGNSKDARVDVLIVGEGLKRQKGEKVFELLGAELGRELLYTIMDVEEYEYRTKMYDKFIRDIIDMPHEKVIDKISKKGPDTRD
jgi:hypothetical protein